MKKITLTPKEFMLFKQLAHFWFNFAVCSGIITVEADAKLLESIGY